MNRIGRLALLQLEQYDTKRFMERKGVVDESVIDRIKWTTRLKLTNVLSFIIGIVGANLMIGAVVGVYEKWVWHSVRRRIRLLKKSGMKVVVIAGSYGKTSVKHYGRELLRTHCRVVTTPESYNTIMGIAKCLEYEVDDKTELFIVEVGAYKIGDITHLLQMVVPDCCALTGIARQHLERFGSWENIIVAKMEIAHYAAINKLPLIANAADPTIKREVAKLNSNVFWYKGISRHEINIAGARQIAMWAGLKNDQIHLNKIREPKNRFEMTTERYGMTVIDDSFSSNEVGFVDAISYLGKQIQYTRILVTPGLVELGSESSKIHEQLGKGVIGNADYLILVGKNERTKSLEKGVGKVMPVIYIDKTLDFMQSVKNLKLKKEPMVLLENDVPENY